jgi:hypothetical protein
MNIQGVQKPQVGKQNEAGEGLLFSSW